MQLPDASWLSLAIAVGVPLVGGSIIGALIAQDIRQWYPTLRKPSWNPPDWVFGPIWSLLYISMGIASWLVWSKGGFVAQGWPLGIYCAQLVANLSWSSLFFKLHRLDLALYDIIALDVLVLGTITAFAPVIGTSLTLLLLLPYLVWIGFATVLSEWLHRHNPKTKVKH